MGKAQQGSTVPGYVVGHPAVSGLYSQYSVTLTAALQAMHLTRGNSQQIGSPSLILTSEHPGAVGSKLQYSANVTPY